MAERDATIARKQAEYERTRPAAKISRHQIRRPKLPNPSRVQAGPDRAAIALFVGSHTINTIRQPDGSWDIEVEDEGGIVDLEQGAGFLPAPRRKATSCSINRYVVN
ncbi:MAG: hypothetical protein R3E51_00790 [Rhizobiaceae bacterium]